MEVIPPNFRRLLNQYEVFENVAFLISIAFVVYCLWKFFTFLLCIYKIIFTPMNKIVPLGKIGFINHENIELSESDLVEKTRSRRDFGDSLPPAYANGWYRVMDSMHLQIGEVKQVRIVGKNLVLFRGKSGVAVLMDAYCAHMGANLAVGGRVLGDCLQCPFHGWKFDGKGNCVDIPYSKSSKTVGKQATWYVREINGHIMTWYHSEGVSPEWEIPRTDEMKNMKYCGRTEHHVNCHMMDIPENGYDEPHLRHLHLPFFLSGCDLRTQFDSVFNFCDSNLNTNYKDLLQEKEKHVAKIYLKHEFYFFKKFKLLPIHFEIYQIGPASVKLFASFAFGKAIIHQFVTPADPLDQVFVHTFHISRHLPIFIGKILLYSVGVQVDRDLMVWNNRTYMRNPLLQKEEAVQKTFRRWMSQFYTKNSTKCT